MVFVYAAVSWQLYDLTCYLLKSTIPVVLSLDRSIYLPDRRRYLVLPLLMKANIRMLPRIPANLWRDCPIEGSRRIQDLGAGSHVVYGKGSGDSRREGEYWIDCVYAREQRCTC